MFNLLEGKEPIVGQIRGLEGLKNLEISNYRVGAEGLSVAEGLQELEYLNFKMCAFGTDSLSFVEGLKRLKHLHLDLYGSSKLTDLSGLRVENLRDLEHLDLSLSAESDFDLGQISQLNKLVHLDLGKVSLTDSDLKHFSNLKNLDKLDRWGGRTTPKGRFKLYRDLAWDIEKSLESEGVGLSKKRSKIIIRGSVELSDELLQAISQLNWLSDMQINGNTDAMKFVGIHPFKTPFLYLSLIHI